MEGRTTTEQTATSTEGRVAAGSTPINIAHPVESKHQQQGVAERRALNTGKRINVSAV